MNKLTTHLSNPKLLQRFVCPFCEKILALKTYKEDKNMTHLDLDIQCYKCSCTFGYKNEDLTDPDCMEFYLSEVIYPYKDTWINIEYLDYFMPGPKLFTPRVMILTDSEGYKTILNAPLPFPLTKQELNTKLDKLMLFV